MQYMDSGSKISPPSMKHQLSKIRTLGAKESYKYSVIMNADTIIQVEMKEKKLRKRYN